VLFRSLRALRKDNTGYDLKQLFIGAEGTLGVVTAATLKLHPKPAAHVVSFVGLDSPAAAVALLDHMKSCIGDALSAFEIIPKAALDLVLAHIPNTRAPMSDAHPWNVLVELSFQDAATAEARAQAALGDALEKGLANDIAIAANETQAKDLWHLRESVPEAERTHAVAIKHDISVPVSRIAQFMDEGGAAALKLAPGATLIAFGHVGDGNIHFNIAKPDAMERDAFLALQHDIHDAVHDVVERLGGSISAEHGIGVLKKSELARRRAGPEMDMMWAVKRALDPAGIMNPRMLFADDEDLSS